MLVETEVLPVNRPVGEDSIARPFEFPDADYARRFVDEALLALEYLNCVVEWATPLLLPDDPVTRPVTARGERDSPAGTAIHRGENECNS